LSVDFRVVIRGSNQSWKSFVAKAAPTGRTRRESGIEMFGERAMNRIWLVALGLLLAWTPLSVNGLSDGMTLKNSSGSSVGDYADSYALLLGASEYPAARAGETVPVRTGLTREASASLERQVLMHALTINASPANARIRILNIRPRYQPGMQLSPGRYHIEVSKTGYSTHKGWITLGSSNVVKSVQLEKRTDVNASPATRTTIVAIEMVNIPGGSFMMGSNEGDDDEKPVHRVTISGFQMGKYEVTQAQWKSVMGSNPSNFKGVNRPVEEVSWDAVQLFIRKLNSQTGQHFRLPTEAEWEYAARAGTSSKWSWGRNESQAGSFAWYRNNAVGQTHPVGLKRTNGFGLYDMHGNVWEWVYDWYGPYSSGDATNPTGPRSDRGHVHRGGSWNSYTEYMGSASRYVVDSPDFRAYDLGFRLIRQ